MGGVTLELLRWTTIHDHPHVLVCGLRNGNGRPRELVHMRFDLARCDPSTLTKGKDSCQTFEHHGHDKCQASGWKEAVS